MRDIDFTSDSCTLPTEEIQDAIRNAEGVNWRADLDVNLNKLLEKAKELTGKEAAILVPSGTMGNVLAAMTHAEENRYGSEVILSEQSHNYWYESAGISRIASLSIRRVNTERGHISVEDLKKAIRPDNETSGPITTMLWTENPNMLCGGSLCSVEQGKDLYLAAKEAGLHVHMDGARLFNAAVALGVDAKEITQWTDSVVFALSKGLACPVGSVLCGTKEFIGRAVRNRKMLGGVLTKAGGLAAGGLLALETMIDRLADDHENAKLLARGLDEVMPGSVNLEEIQVNLVRLRPQVAGLEPEEFKKIMADNGIHIITLPGGYARFAINWKIGKEHIEETLGVIKEVVETCNQQIKVG